MNIIVFLKLNKLIAFLFSFYFMATLVSTIFMYLIKNGIWHYNLYDLLTLFSESFFILAAITSIQSIRFFSIAVFLFLGAVCFYFFYDYNQFFLYPHPYFGFAKAILVTFLGFFYFYWYLVHPIHRDENLSLSYILFVSPIIYVNSLLPISFLFLNYMIKEHLNHLISIYTLATSFLFLCFHAYYIYMAYTYPHYFKNLFSNEKVDSHDFS